MRRVVTIIDENGESKVLSDGFPATSWEQAPEGVANKVSGPTQPPAPGTAVVHEIWKLTRDPIMTTHDVGASMTAPDFEMESGTTKWIVTEMGPNLHVPMHFTQTVDYGYIAEGDLVIGLSSGPVQLHAGDAIVVNGPHSWDSGPNGCKIITVQVGLDPSQR
jgi:mannose-6-phosphate isomerase-like protein (cupin superfamily)